MAVWDEARELARLNGEACLVAQCKVTQFVMEGGR